MKRLAILTLAALFAGAAAFAQGGGPPNRMMRGMRMDMHQEMMKQLNLTEDQQSQIQKLHLNLEKKQAELRAKIQVAQIDMRELMLTDNLDKAAIEKKMDAVADLRGQSRKNMIDHWFAVYNMLKPEQQKIWKQQHAGMIGGGRGQCPNCDMMGGMRHGMKHPMGRGGRQWMDDED